MSDPVPFSSQGVVGLTLVPGDKVQHYTVAQLIGAGGTSAVFKAHDALLNRHVAIKQVLLAPGEEADSYRARVLAEAAAHRKAAAADPAMLVQLLDVVADPRGIMLITEYVDGPSLEQILQANPAPMDERQAMGILAGAAKGLAALHGAGILHRDLKPANILMPRSGGLRLADFGLSVSAHSQQLVDQGTMRYLAPEVLSNHPATPASDLYALGMVAYEMLAGRTQYDDAFKAILRDQRNQAMRWVKWHTNPKIKPTPLAQLNPSLSPATLELVERLMDKDALRRIQSAQDVLGAIRSIVTTPAPSAHTEGTPPPWLAQHGSASTAGAGDTARIPKRKAWPMVAAGAGAAVLLAAILATALSGDKKPDPKALDRAHVLDMMAQGEAAWKANHYAQALEIFQSMQDGGADARKPGTPSRLFADAGAAKCQAVLAHEARRHAQAKAAMDQFIALGAEMEAKPKGTYPESLRMAPLPMDIQRGIRDRKEVADALDRMRDLLDQNKAQECVTVGNLWLRKDGVLEEETAQIKKLLAECSMSRKDLLVNRLLDRAQKLADSGDSRAAVELLNDELKAKGDAADPRVAELMEKIVARSKLDQLVAKYQQAETSDEKISLLNAILAVDPEYKDKDKLPLLKADLVYVEAKKAADAGEFEQADKLAEEGLTLAPIHAQLRELRGSLAKSIADKKLILDAETLFDAGNWAQAKIAYENVAAKVSVASIVEKARERIKMCDGNAQKAAGLELLNAGELTKAETALKAAQENLPEDADIAAAFDRIKNLREEQKLRQAATDVFDRKDYAGAVTPTLKWVTFLKAHPTAGNLDAAQEQLRLCRFENNMANAKDAMNHANWNSASGALGAAGTYAKTPEEKVRVKKALQALEDAMPK